MKRSRVSVSVEPAEGPPIDMETWSRMFVAMLLELDAEDCGERPADEGRIGA